METGLFPRALTAPHASGKPRAVGSFAASAIPPARARSPPCPTAAAPSRDATTVRSAHGIWNQAGSSGPWSSIQEPCTQSASPPTAPARSPVATTRPSESSTSESGGEIKRFEGISSPIWCAAFSPDGTRVVAGGENGAVYLGDAMTSDPVTRLNGHFARVWDVAVTVDGGQAISAGQDGRLICWDLIGKLALHQVKLDDAQIRCIALEADNRHVVFGTQRASADNYAAGSIGDWDITTDGPVLAPRRRRWSRSLFRVGSSCQHDAHRCQPTAEGWSASGNPPPPSPTPGALSAAGKRRRRPVLRNTNKAVANRPSDPRLLIERGRLLATLGQAQKAAVDFENAASIAPESPQFFLDSPWWVAGPYPPDYSQAGLLENATATDPSQPAPALGNTTVRWREIAPHQQGRLDFEELFKANGSVVGYAMTVVYSARPRETALLIGTDDAARIWLNGSEVFSSKSSSAPDSNAILATLQSGRNTFVVKVQDLVKGGHSFSIRFGESPADLARAYARAGKPKEASEFFNRAMALDPDNFDRVALEQLAEAMAQAERWKEAKTAFEKIYALDPGNFGKQHALAKIYLALGDQSAYERLCTAAIARHGKTQDPKLANDLIWLAALMPNALRSYAAVVDIGSKLVKGRNPDPNSFNTFGALLSTAAGYYRIFAQLSQTINRRRERRRDRMGLGIHRDGAAQGQAAG